MAEATSIAPGTKSCAVVIGGGVVGCAVAERLSRHFEVFVLEKGPRIAEGVTSRNSGVIHAGLYYPPGSLKADSCLRGKALLYEWCRMYGVAHRQTGKWVVAQEGEEESLQELFENARASGATGLSWTQDLDEAGCRGVAAIHSLETGIVDPYEITASLLSKAVENGAMLCVDTDVLAISRKSSGGYLVSTSRGEMEAEVVVNCAGLHADEVSRMVGIETYSIYPWRGDYYRLRTKVPYRALIYPAKNKAAPGLGIHLTIDLNGECKLGPDVEAVESKTDFAPPHNDAEKREIFFLAASRYLPGLKREDLTYDTCGIRPKLRSPNDKAEKDFIIAEDLPGFVNLVGIESPGLTASLDLADRVLTLLR